MRRIRMNTAALVGVMGIGLVAMALRSAEVFRFYRTAGATGANNIVALKFPGFRRRGNFGPAAIYTGKL